MRKDFQIPLSVAAANLPSPSMGEGSGMGVFALTIGEERLRRDRLPCGAPDPRRASPSTPPSSHRGRREKASAYATLVACTVALAACSTAVEAMKGPQLAPIGYPAQLVPVQQQVIVPQQPQPASANSLWRAGARTFFNDQRARNVGDILTVNIDIDDRAQVANSTSRSRSNEVQSGVGALFGLESSLGKLFPQGFDPANMVEMGGESSSQGNGVITRSEKVSLTIAAVVTGVLPNGNLIIQGRQEVKTNREVRELTVAGIVRPEDVSSANTINHTQIAEARIAYGGRGDVTRMQQAPAGQNLLERFSPF